MSTEDKKEADAILEEITRRIKDVFDVFDHENNHTTDVRDVGTILRALGCFPSEGELKDILAEAEDDDDSTGTVRYDKLLPTLSQILLENRYRPQNEDTLRRAFKVLDPENTGEVNQEQFTKLMTTVGEAFTQEELDEMLTVAADPQTGGIKYNAYIPFLMPDD